MQVCAQGKLTYNRQGRALLRGGGGEHVEVSGGRAEAASTGALDARAADNTLGATGGTLANGAVPGGTTSDRAAGLNAALLGALVANEINVCAPCRAKSARLADPLLRLAAYNCTALSTYGQFGCSGTLTLPWRR